MLPVLVPAACATPLYEGPRRPESQIARLASEDTRINYVDGKRLRNFWRGNKAKYEILPGWYRLGVSLDQTTFYVVFKTLKYSGSVTVCLQAEAGHKYVTKPVVSRKTWSPTIVDVDTGESVEEDCDPDE